MCIRDSCNGAKRPVSIFVPVNLRPIFGTETSLNFFSNLTIILPLARRAVPFEDVMEAVKRQFAEKLTREEFEQKLAFTAVSYTHLDVYKRQTPCCSPACART